MNKEQFLSISEQMIQRYSNRYRVLGRDVRTLGWGSLEQQSYRFEQTLSELFYFEDKTILDIGCGFGDYLALLKAKGYMFKQYIGWDINPDLIQEARKIWTDNNVSFVVKNIGNESLENPIADIAVMLGVLNLNLKEQVDNYEYSFHFIRNAFACVREVLIVDFLSTKFALNYPLEDFVFYHEPSKMLDFALSLSSDVVLKHNYAPIPQKEFMLFIYKQ
jgi:SAM-dependent methyltransferase